MVTSKLPFSILFDRLFRAIDLSLGSKKLRYSFWGFGFVFFFVSLYMNMNFCPPMFNLANWLTLTFTSAMWSQQIKALSISTYHRCLLNHSPHIHHASKVPILPVPYILFFESIRVHDLLHVSYILFKYFE